MTTARVTQAVLEVAQQGPSSAQSSQLVLEVSVPFVNVATPPGALSSQLVLEVAVGIATPVSIMGSGAESQTAFAGSVAGELALAGSQASQFSTQGG